MKQKHLDYLAPEAEILVVRFEGNLLNGSPTPTFNSVNGTEELFDAGDEDF